MVTVYMSVSITKVYTALSTTHAYHNMKEARDPEDNRLCTVIPTYILFADSLENTISLLAYM